MYRRTRYTVPTPQGFRRSEGGENVIRITLGREIDIVILPHPIAQQVTPSQITFKNEYHRTYLVPGIC